MATLARKDIMRQGEMARRTSSVRTLTNVSLVRGTSISREYGDMGDHLLHGSVLDVDKQRHGL